jgi:hypothetical protein
MATGLTSDDVDLVGAWVVENGRVVGDAVEQQINALLPYLEKVGSDETGWDTLYRDPVDGRFWELVYPQGYMHGGGPKRLTCLSESTASAKYPLAMIHP